MMLDLAMHDKLTPWDSAIGGLQFEDHGHIDADSNAVSNNYGLPGQAS